MKLSRREWSMLIPVLAAAQTATKNEVLPSKVYPESDIPLKGSGANRSRQFLTGDTHNGCTIDLHTTELAAGEMPHAAHHHVHEEMIMIREGTMEITIEGKVTRVGPGSVVYVASNEEHGWRNVGTTTAKYFVLALGRDRG